ncbi:MAG: YbaB/EbfC family nucleoid-associated protein [Alphaproteobacteria bacterium]
MKDLMGLMKQAKEMQSKMEAAQAKVSDLEAEGRAGAGLVSLTVSGEGHMKSLKIDPSILNPDDGEIVEDLIIAAFNDAKVKLDAAKESTMKSAFGDMPMPPGMKMPF